MINKHQKINLAIHQKKHDFSKRLPSFIKPLRNFCKGLTHNLHDAEDLCQDTFFRAMQKWETYNEDNLFNWLCTIAARLYLNNLRRKKNVSLTDNDLIELCDHCENDGELLLIRCMIEKVIDSMPPDVKTIYHGRLQGNSFKDIASATRSKTNTILTKYHNAKPAMKIAFAELR